MLGRQKMAAMVAEFLGAGVLTLVILTVLRSQIGVPFFVGASAGLAIVVMTLALSRASGTYFNPALTLAMWTVRRVSTLTAVVFIAMQLLGGLAAYTLYKYFVNEPLPEVGGKFSGPTMVAEVVGTAIFSFGVAAVVYQGLSRPVKAAFGGLALMLGVLAASSASIGLLNPAVALGINAWVWGTYVLGPVVGALIGVNLYSLLFAEANPLATAPSVPVELTTTTKTTKKAATKPKRKTTAKKKSTRAKR